MEVEVQWIVPNDFLDLDEFSRYESRDPYDDYAWFSLTIGVKGEQAGNNFEVLVATPKAVARLKQSGSIPGLIVNRFEPQVVLDAIRNHVASLKGHAWFQFVDQLRKTMHWEYEGMCNPPRKGKR